MVGEHCCHLVEFNRLFSVYQVALCENKGPLVDCRIVGFSSVIYGSQEVYLAI